MLSKTNMVDFAMEIHKELHGAPPPAMAAKRDEVTKAMQALKEEAGPILALVEDGARGRAEGGALLQHGYLSAQLSITTQHPKRFAGTRSRS